jgi:hypothetical protein
MRTKLFFVVFLLCTGMFIACQKPFHEENERYILVAANISLPYWQCLGSA